FLADRGGFEPPIRLSRIHAFQACAFNHSATCPDLGHACSRVASKKLATTRIRDSSRNGAFAVGRSPNRTYDCVIRATKCLAAIGNSAKLTAYRFSVRS